MKFEAIFSSRCHERCLKIKPFIAELQCGTRVRVPDSEFSHSCLRKIDGALQTEFAHLACYLREPILSWRSPIPLIALMQKFEHL